EGDRCIGGSMNTIWLCAILADCLNSSTCHRCKEGYAVLVAKRQFARIVGAGCWAEGERERSIAIGGDGKRQGRANCKGRISDDRVERHRSARTVVDCN